MALYDGTNAPLIKVYLDTGNRTSGLFTLGWSQLGVSDVLGNYTPFTTLTQITTNDVKRISIRRGRTREDQQIQAGVLTLTMDNTSGSYDPEYAKGATVTAATGSAGTVTYTSANDFKVGEIVSIRNLSVSALNLTLQTIVSASSTQFTVSNPATGSCSGQSATANTGWVYFDPNTAKVNSLLVAGTGVRVTATITYGGGPQEINLFSGFIEQIDKDMSLQPVTTITCVDGLAMMAKLFTTINTNALGDYTAISRILNSAGWNFGTAGSTNDLYIVSEIETGDVLTMVDPIVRTQPGAMFYCNPSGQATWLNYGVFDLGSFAGKTKMFTMTDSRVSNDVVEYDEISVIGGEKYMRNTVTINNTDPNGNPSTVTKFNQDGVARFGTFGAQVDTFYSSAYTSTIAQQLADQFASPLYRVDSIGFECVGFSSQLWYKILNSDLGSAVQVSRTPIYTSNYAFDYDCYIQEMNHDIYPDSWRMSLTLSPGT
jgi:hypothetical protein